jgi:phosphoribosyl-ATP pyrophosphohydrolase
MNDLTPTPKDAHDALARLHAVIETRRRGDPETSYVARLFHKGPDAFLKKVGEEATEFAMAGKDLQHASEAELSDRRHKLVGEAADLWFHSLLGLAYFGIKPQAVLDELARREGMSGLEEKAARKAQSREANGE